MSDNLIRNIMQQKKIKDLEEQLDVAEDMQQELHYLTPEMGTGAL